MSVGKCVCVYVCCACVCTCVYSGMLFHLHAFFYNTNPQSKVIMVSIKVGWETG